MEKQKITYIKREDKVSAGGKKYERVTIKTDRHADSYVSGFGSKATNSWAVGTEIEVTVKPREYNGKTYYDFEVPKTEGGGSFPNSDKIVLALTEIIARLDHIERKIDAQAEPSISDMADIPFDGDDNL